MTSHMLITSIQQLTFDIGVLLFLSLRHVLPGRNTIQVVDKLVVIGDLVFVSQLHLAAIIRLVYLDTLVEHLRGHLCKIKQSCVR